MCDHMISTFPNAIYSIMFVVFYFQTMKNIEANTN